MKKLFISCPMKGRTEENIRKSLYKMHKIAEAVFEQELEVIPTYTEDNPPENAKQAIWHLGKSIQRMAEADCFVGPLYASDFNGCTVEKLAARLYGIPSYELEMEIIAPDISKNTDIDRF